MGMVRDQEGQCVGVSLVPFGGIFELDYGLDIKSSTDPLIIFFKNLLKNITYVNR